MEFGELALVVQSELLVVLNIQIGFVLHQSEYPVLFQGEGQPRLVEQLFI